MILLTAGKKERSINNNHGVYYDKILASFAGFAGDRRLVLNILNDFMENRIAKQVDHSGEMPHEMSRADAHHYLIWSLNGLVAMAMFGDNYGVDLWNTTSSNQSSVKKALDWSIGFIDKTKNWPYSATFDPSLQRFLEIFWRTSVIYKGAHDDIFQKYILIKQDPKYIQSHLFNLICPRHPSDQLLYTDSLIKRNFC